MRSIQDNKKLRSLIILITPIFILIFCNLVARISSFYLKEWAWTSTAVLYWSVLGFVTFATTRREEIKSWFQKSQSKLWIVILILLGLSPFPILFIPNYSLLDSTHLVIFWLLFAPINAFFEEIYWRGLIYSTNISISKWVVLIYTTIIFAILHPLMWGVFSEPLRVPSFIGIAFLLGIMLSLGYLKTKSLKWAIFSHCLIDLGNLSIIVFMNIYKIPGN
ncbi:CPBP family intramembrane metalloprotease [Clostridium bowmanii]|uniref:CPBP family intramembrane glutamic endopeptidase n=1 Tax=Clostridium bowmanii TaxID=132925 RepID=UPI001C0C7C26|nr:CPBP family intramembrane glutamic endopeptidase [Clostridium bowmanii]MBU3189679.1 CPBP family intramembrane metalloprotease [Clostridium bowmanii]MCA1074161.1 CPBP family intramembrane metalloprotease [Clostridium bowmanii]